MDENMMAKTKFHRDGSVTVWDIYAQRWQRTAKPSDRVLASLSSGERERVLRHTQHANELDFAVILDRDDPDVAESLREAK